MFATSNYSEEISMSYSISKKITQIVASLSLVAFFASVSQVALADDSAAVKTIAGVLVGLNHFPSADDKAALAAIAADDAHGMAVRALANAVANIQHAATAEDKAAMEQIVASDMTDMQSKSLAQIVLGINHMPSAEAKASLQAML
jgi:hypothetical protein